MRRILTMLLSAALSLSLLAVPAAASSPAVLLRGGEGAPGGTLEVSVVLRDNPGIANLTLNVGFDESVLTLQGVRDAGLLGSQLHSDNLHSPYCLTWANDLATVDYTASGVLAVLTFAVSPGAKTGVYPVTLTCQDCYNVDLDDVAIGVEDGTVKVEDSGGTVTVIPVSSGLNVTVSPKSGLDWTKGFCAAYDENGRMLAAAALTPALAGKTVPLSCDSSRAVEVKAFLLDAWLRPVVTALMSPRLR